MFKSTSSIWFTLTIAVFLTFVTEISCKPAYVIDDDFYGYNTVVATRRSGVISDPILSSLKRGYYYIDNGSIVPVKEVGKRISPNPVKLSLRSDDVADTARDIVRQQKRKNFLNLKQEFDIAD
ncbi:uncharacterized protein [Musca autumnalis]|uniref:uncharacterized protein n=1 Tax=Musca autumnalis TaxID=221902 RepID=UPI003CF17702